MTWDKWLINYNSNATITAYDMSNVVTENPSSLTSYSITPAFGTAVTNVVANTYRTDSNTGLICMFDKAHSQAVVIDLTTFDGTTFTTNELIPNCIMACCIGNTRKIAYIPSNATDTIIIYDYDRHQIYTTLTMPSLTNSPSIMIGLNGYVWISDSSAANTYCINIENGGYQVCERYIPWGSGSTYGNFMCSFTDNFFVGYNVGDTLYSHSQSFVVRSDEPTRVKLLSNLRFTNDPYKWGNLGITLRNVETNTSNHTCAMIMSSRYSMSTTGCANIIIDLGQYYAEGNESMNLDNLYTDGGNSSNTNGTIIPYGQFIMIDNRIQTPLEYAMPHKVVAKTRTITTQHGYKNISGKTWSTTFTNTPKFHGLPPGTMATINR
jgi:hypothetical protein